LYKIVGLPLTSLILTLTRKPTDQVTLSLNPTNPKPYPTDLYPKPYGYATLYIQFS